jgi:hypothetical protein
MLPTPEAPGRYPLVVAHLDNEGEEVSGQAGLYAIPADRPLVAVEADALPEKGSKQRQAARDALAKLAESADLIYLTRRSPGDHAQMHREFDAAGFPDGPILLWQRQLWHMARRGPYKIPVLVVETRLVSQIAQLRETFPQLSSGVCGSSAAAKAFAESGLRVMVVGDAARGTSAERYASWDALAAKGN